MSIVKLGDLLDRARDFEIELEQRYADLRDQTADNGVRLLTYYLARHRRHQELALKDCEPERLAHIRKAELRHDIQFKPEQENQALIKIKADMSGQQLLEAAIAYDQALINLYRAILEQPLIDEIRMVLESLIRMEERDIVMMKKMLAMHYF